VNFTLDFEYTFRVISRPARPMAKRRALLIVSWYIIAAMFTLAIGC